MKIYFASDHAGFELKKALIAHMQSKGFEIQDCGPFSFDPHDDYPPLIRAAIEKLSADLARGVESRAIIFGKSGQGEALVANRVKGIRAVVFYGGPKEILTLSREHGDANVLSLAAGFLSAQEAVDATDLWLSTPFSGLERHQRRLNMLD